MALPTRILARFSALCTVAIALEASAALQLPTTSGGQPAQPAAARTDAGVTARALARIATTDLKLVGVPKERDYRLAAEILEIASAIDPSDQDILRLLLEARVLAFQDDLADDATRRLVRLDPDDSVAALRLIANHISRLQDADERLAEYDRLLGKAGAGIDPAIRSRLALDAALLRRERGDTKEFIKLLLQASNLDPTNKDAATLAYTVFAERSEDPVGRLELLLNVLRADPFDGEIYRTIGVVLSSNGAYRGALRFYALLSDLLNLRTISMPDDVLAEREAVQFCVDGPAALIESLNAQVHQAREELRIQLLQAAESKNPPKDLPTPEEIRLKLPSERSRLFAACALGNAQLIDAALAEAVETLRQSIALLGDPLKRPENITQDQATEAIRGLHIESAWIRLIADRQIEQAAQDIQTLATDPAADPFVVRRLNAWLALRRGELDAAQTALTDLADSDAIAEVGLAVLAETRGDKPAAADRYAVLAERLAGSIAGAFARTRYLLLTGRAPTPADGGELASKLDKIAADVPRWLEPMMQNPRKIVGVRAELLNRNVGLLDKPLFRISIRNVSPMPLALGPDKPINSRFLLCPSAEVGINSVLSEGLQEVVSVNRRLRLLPQEELTADVWADPGLLGVLLQQWPGDSARIRWRILQGFMLTRTGLYASGPLGVAVDAGPLLRVATPRADNDAAALAGFIETGTQSEAIESILAFSNSKKLSGPKGRASPEEQELLINAVLRRFPSLDRAGKLAFLAYVPNQARVPLAKGLDLLAAQETDEAVLTFLLIARIGDAADPLLLESAWAAHPAVGAVAADIRERLAEGGTCYSRVVPYASDAADKEGDGAVPPSAAAPATPAPAAPASGAVPESK